MIAFKYLGFLFVLIGSVGIVLPLLPTTPFLLLAAGCFSRSSPRWHAWLLSSRVLGPVIFRWEQQRCVSCKTKFVALASMLLMGGYTLFYTVVSPVFMLFGSGFILIGAVIVMSLSICDKRSISAVDR